VAPPVGYSAEAMEGRTENSARHTPEIAVALEKVGVMAVGWSKDEKRGKRRACITLPPIRSASGAYFFRLRIGLSYGNFGGGHGRQR
jgi:hypothetical protein